MQARLTLGLAIYDLALPILFAPIYIYEDNKNRRRDTALTLFSKFRKKDFLHKIITGDEKWILYDNPKHRKSWVDPRPWVNHRHRRQNSMPRRFCSVSDGQVYYVLYYELLQPGEIITADRYQQQLTI